MADHGLKIAQPLKDVKTCPDKDLMWTSKFSSLKVKLQGSGSVTIPANQNSAKATINHNLGYKPAFLVFIKDEQGGGRDLCHSYKVSPISNMSGTASWARNNDIQIYAYRDDLYVPFDEPAVFGFYYYIFYEKAE